MSRKRIFGNDFTTIYYGDDHAIGEFIQICDNRYTLSGKDQQGEGWVLEWDSMFKFTTNLIGATEADLAREDNPDHLIKMVDKFIEELYDSIENQ